MSAPTPDAAPGTALGTESDLELRARAGKAVRDLGHALVGHESAPDLLAEVAGALEELTARLDTGGDRSRDPAEFQSERNDWAVQPGQVMLTSNDDRPVSGRSSPWGLDTVVRRVGDEVEATVTLRSAHEGAPARSHGGVVAALFDDIFGFVLAMLQTPGFTGELTIRYEGPTPLHVPLVCRVRLASREGRKLYMTGELVTPEGTVCVRSKATFIVIDPARVSWGDGV